MTDALTKPLRPAKGQRWHFDGRTKESTWEVEEDPNNWAKQVTLRKVEGDVARGEKRHVYWDRLVLVYTYVGDFSVPEGYTIHKVGLALGGHCYKTPAGNVVGGTQSDPWTWKRARDEAVAHAEGRRAV